MVTSCNLAFTHRLSLQGQLHLLNALIVPGPLSQWARFRTRDELVPIPSGPVLPGGVEVHLILGGRGKLDRKGEASKFMEGKLKCNCF